MIKKLLLPALSALLLLSALPASAGDQPRPYQPPVTKHHGNYYKALPSDVWTHRHQPRQSPQYSHSYPHGNWQKGRSSCQSSACRRPVVESHCYGDCRPPKIVIRPDAPYLKGPLPQPVYPHPSCQPQVPHAYNPPPTAYHPNPSPQVPPCVELQHY